MKTPKPKRAKPNAKPNQQARTVTRWIIISPTEHRLDGLFLLYRSRSMAWSDLHKTYGSIDGFEIIRATIELPRPAKRKAL